MGLREISLMSVLETASRKLRVASYNIHKCQGIDHRVRPERIAGVLDELDADIVALQEVVGPGSGREEDHARRVAEGRGYYAVFGKNRTHQGAAYGNLLLSRYPVLDSWNYDITTGKREPRGVLRADVKMGDGRVLHLFNVHLGTAYSERREQAGQLVSERILCNQKLAGSRIVLGDFNEWFPDLASRLLAAHCETLRSRALSVRCRTYPGFLPLLRLDHIYFDGGLKLRGLACHRSRTALVASDHLPIVAEFHLPVRTAASHALSSYHSYVVPDLRPKHGRALPPA